MSKVRVNMIIVLNSELLNPNHFDKDIIPQCQR